MKSIICFVLSIHAIVCMFESGYAQSQMKDRAKLLEDAKKEGKVVVYVRPMHRMRRLYLPAMESIFIWLGTDDLIYDFQENRASGVSFP